MPLNCKQTRRLVWLYVCETVIPFILYVIVIYVACAFFSRVFAQTVTPHNEANLSWNAVTTYDNFAVITDPVTYSIYAGLKGQPKTRVQAGITGTSSKRSNIPAGIWCWTVRAVVNGVESEDSGEICKDANPPAIPLKPAKPEDFKFSPPDPRAVSS